LGLARTGFFFRSGLDGANQLEMIAKLFVLAQWPQAGLAAL
jgi:hypothetical protein